MNAVIPVCLCFLGLAIPSVARAQEDLVSKTYEIGEAGAKKSFTLKFPKTWENQPVSNNLRLAQFKIPGGTAETSAELSIFPTFGGTATENINRQIATFQSQGRQLVTKKGTCEQGDYVLADLTGTWNKPVGPPVQGRTEPVAGQRMLYVILTLKSGGNVFLKLVGPEKTVTDAAAPLRTSFGGDTAKEADFKLE